MCHDCAAPEKVDGGRCFPALVSSLLIRSDQLRRSMFGFRSARSTLAAQWSNLRFVVQLSYRPSSPRCALLALSPSSQRACFFQAYRPGWHSLTPAWTVAGNGFTSYRDAADLMAPALSAGMLVVFSTLAIKPFGD